MTFQQTTALFVTCCLFLGCPARTQDPGLASDVTETASEPLPNPNTQTDASLSPDTGVTSQPTTSPMDIIRPDASVGQVDPGRVSTHPLEERYRVGARIRRQVRVERRYQLRVESDLVGSAEGASEINREYTLQIDDAFRGQIRTATIEILADRIRFLPVGDRRPRLSVDLGPLHASRLECQASGEGRFSCDGRDSHLSSDMVGVHPQLLELFPPEPVAIGESWSLDRDLASRFLGIEGGEISVRFLLEKDDASFRGETCHRVEYAISGNQPVAVLGSTLQGSLTGGGEYYYCRARRLVLNHRQERSLSVNGVLRRGNQRIPVERSEQFVYEEESFLENSGLVLP